MKVLIVEDDPVQRIALESLFLRDHKVKSFAVSNDALHERADLAIIDLMIDDGMSGIDLARSLKSRNDKMKIIIYTAVESGMHWRQAVEVADKVISKKYSLEQMRDAIESVIHG